MATEILGFLIIVGILIVFIVRRDLWNGTSSRADEVEEASVKMRLQMEHSANAIITPVFWGLIGFSVQGLKLGEVFTNTMGKDLTADQQEE